MCEIYRQAASSILIEVWLKAVEDLRMEVVTAGLEEVFKKHKEFMPTPAQFRECCEIAALKIRFEPEPLENQRRRNVLDDVRDVAREMYPKYDKLDATKDAKKIERLFRHANIVRYLRVGIEPTWIPKAEIAELRKFA